MLTIYDVFLILTILIIQLFYVIAAKEHQSLRRKTTNNIESDRNLQLQFMNFQPTSDVVDYANTDLDLKEIKREVLRHTVDGFKNAREIYENGAYSGSYSVLTLQEGFPRALRKGEQIYGLSTVKRQTNGKLRKAINKGDTIIEVEYPTSNYCRVNGASPTRELCFAETGFLRTDMEKNLKYSYSIKEDTKNGRSIQKLSTITTEMYNDTTADDYITIFKNYYGRYDYADHLIMAAFNEDMTDFDNGNANFALYFKEGRSEVINMGGSLMIVWMHIVLKMGEAIDSCQMEKNDDIQHSDAIDTTENNYDNYSANNMNMTESWDEAVAYYFGSQENGRLDSGYFPYSYANRFCKHFGTCGTLVFSQAQANMETTSNFVLGQENLKEGKCEDAKDVRDTIVRLMTIPLIQGTLHSAYIAGVEMSTSEETRAEGAVLAASVLPLVHSCSAEDATTIYNNMRVGAESTPDFRAVKAAFENNYDCLGITCEDIGGIINTDRSTSNLFSENAWPCGYDPNESRNSESATEDNDTNEEGIRIPIEATIGITVGAVFVLALLLGIYEYFFGTRWY